MLLSGADVRGSTRLFHHVMGSLQRIWSRKLSMNGLNISHMLEDRAGTDIVIEAVPEKIDLKKEIFGRIDRICAQDTVLATNTSSFSITELGASTDRPDKVIGTHFFCPV